MEVAAIIAVGVARPPYGPSTPVTRGLRLAGLRVTWRSVVALGPRRGALGPTRAPAPVTPAVGAPTGEVAEAGVVP